MKKKIVFLSKEEEYWINLKFNEEMFKMISRM